MKRDQSDQEYGSWLREIANRLRRLPRFEPLVVVSSRKGNSSHRLPDGVILAVQNLCRVGLSIGESEKVMGLSRGVLVKYRRGIRPLPEFSQPISTIPSVPSSSFQPSNPIDEAPIVQPTPAPPPEVTRPRPNISRSTIYYWKPAPSNPPSIPEPVKERPKTIDEMMLEHEQIYDEGLKIRGFRDALRLGDLSRFSPTELEEMFRAQVERVAQEKRQYLRRTRQQLEILRSYGS